MQNVKIRQYEPSDIPEMIGIWNEVVKEGVAFPQEDCLDGNAGREFFAAQSSCKVAQEVSSGAILGMYILHPNNVGRCGHICNASFAVSACRRSMHIGEKLVLDCMEQAKSLGFRILQFNAVVATNLAARHLYERLGFQMLGVIPGGFRLANGQYEDICVYYITLGRAWA